MKMHRRGTKGKFIKHIDPQSLDRFEAIKYLRLENVFIQQFIYLYLLKRAAHSTKRFEA